MILKGGGFWLDEPQAQNPGGGGSRPFGATNPVIMEEALVCSSSVELACYRINRN